MFLQCKELRNDVDLFQVGAFLSRITCRCITFGINEDKETYKKKDFSSGWGKMIMLFLFIVIVAFVAYQKKKYEEKNFNTKLAPKSEGRGILKLNYYKCLVDLQ